MNRPHVLLRGGNLVWALRETWPYGGILDRGGRGSGAQMKISLQGVISSKRLMPFKLTGL